ncbi:MAG: hypothetical protein Q4P20_07215 [Eubacteriales bacterium]|nr:hypothetical protein [Eubacteriales bacterium]
MQQKDMDALFHAISQQSGSPDTTKAASRLQAALNTPDGRRAAQQVMQHYSGSLEQVAHMAQSGNMEGAKRSVQDLMRTPEGAQLAAQIAKMMGR